MQCHVVRRNAETNKEIIAVRFAFLMGPIVWTPGPGIPVMHLTWNDDGTPDNPRGTFVTCTTRKSTSWTISDNRSRSVAMSPWQMTGMAGSLGR